MAFNPFDALKKVLGSVAGGIPLVGGLIKDTILKIDTEVEKMSPEQRLALENNLRATELENFKLILADSADMRKLAMAELEHPGIKWIRPGILAGTFLMIAFWVTFVPLIEGIFGVTIPSPDLNAIPKEMWGFFVAAYLGYGGLREIGKYNKLKSK